MNANSKQPTQLGESRMDITRRWCRCGRPLSSQNDQRTGSCYDCRCDDAERRDRRDRRDRTRW